MRYGHDHTLRGVALFAVRLLVLLVLLAVTIADGRAAVSETSPDGQFLVSPEEIKAKSKEIAKTAGLEENFKNTLLELYRKSLDNLATAASHESLAAKFVQAIETAPVEIEKIRAAMENRPKTPLQEQDDAAADSASLKEIEQQLLKAKAAYTAIEADEAALSRQLNVQIERAAKAGQRLTEIKAGEEALLDAINAATPANEPPLLTEARNWMQQTQLQALHSETRMLNQEMVSMPVLVELARIQRQEAGKRLDAARSLVQWLETKVNRKRQEEAAQSMDEAKEVMRQAAGSQPVLQQAAARNAELGDALQTVSTALEGVAAEKETLEKELKKVEDTTKTVKQKIELAGLSQALGLLLHEQRRILPDVRQLRKKMSRNQTVIAEAGLLQVQSAEERKKLEELDSFAAELAEGSSPEAFRAMEPELRKILTSRRDLLDKLMTSNQTYLGVLSELEILYHHIEKAVTAIDGFLAERLLWLRGTPFMRLKDFGKLPNETAALLAPDQWRITGEALVLQAGASPLFVLTGLLTVILLGCQGRMRAWLETLVQQASHPATYSFGGSLKAFGLTLLLALSWPLLIFNLGWHLHTQAEATNFTRAVAITLIAFSYRLYFLCVFRAMLLPKGLAAGFFHWPKSTITMLRREAGLFIVTFLPAVFIAQLAFYANFRIGASHVLGRLVLILALVIIAVFFYRILHPKTGVWHRFVKEQSHLLLARLYPLLFLLAILLPVVLSGLVLAGYVVAVGSLLRCLISTVWLALGFVVCHQLIERWLIQSSRKLFRKQALSKHAQAKTGQQPAQPATDKESGPVEEPEEDLVALSSESRRLLDTLVAISALAGLWLVWAEVLPALRIFNEFTLWSYASVVNGQATVVPVTLADAGLTVLIGILTLTATRHFPSLLKIVLLQHLNMSTGSRYTVTTLTRYLIGGTGLMVIASILGFSWSQIQWLVAALGVGIGFGLQEIVANFISGLIILFERPIRVGDVVTIGTTDGVVTRIRIRATTIRDFDRKELLVPNKEFISGRLLNWSLSDPVIRLLLPVGIAYGSDVRTAMALMLQAAEENPLVLDDPRPAVSFDSFGDNALLLNLRCFLGEVDDRVPARSALHEAIDRKFREAGISMAFPQRDVHLDASAPLAIRVVREEDVVPSAAGPGTGE